MVFSLYKFDKSVLKTNQTWIYRQFQNHQKYVQPLEVQTEVILHIIPQCYSHQKNKIIIYLSIIENKAGLSIKKNPNSSILRDRLIELDGLNLDNLENMNRLKGHTIDLGEILKLRQRILIISSCLSQSAQYLIAVYKKDQGLVHMKKQVIDFLWCWGFRLIRFHNPMNQFIIGNHLWNQQSQTQYIFIHNLQIIILIIYNQVDILLILLSILPPQDNLYKQKSNFVSLIKQQNKKPLEKNFQGMKILLFNCVQYNLIKQLKRFQRGFIEKILQKKNLEIIMQMQYQQQELLLIKRIIMEINLRIIIIHNNQTIVWINPKEANFVSLEDSQPIQFKVPSIVIWGNISMYITSYFRYNGYPTIQTRTVSAVFPAIYVGLSMGAFFGVPLARIFGHKYVSFINMVVYSVSMFIATFVNFELFLIFQGFIPGFCIGVEYLIPVDNEKKYSQKIIKIQKGIGFGSLIFNPILQYLANPLNEHPTHGFYSEDVASKIPLALRTLSIIYISIGLSGVLLMRSAARLNLNARVVEGIIKLNSIKEAFDCKELYITWIMLFSLCSFGFLIASHYKEYGIVRIHNDSYFALVGSLAGLTNGLSRFLWSNLADHINHHTLIKINILMIFILSSSLKFISNSQILYLIWIVLIYLQYGGVTTIYSYICAKNFGSYYGPLIFNICFTALPVSNFLQFWLTNRFHDEFIDGYLYFVYTTIALGTYILHIFNPQKTVKTEESKQQDQLEMKLIEE
ncbi:hypothetical protein pb186bvf_015752 [Paramecium bursaria]